MKDFKKEKEVDINDFTVFKGKLSVERAKQAYERIKTFLPDYHYGENVTLVDLNSFLIKKYKAEIVNFKDIDKCTRTKVKRYNKYCNDVFCVSEGHVVNEEYICSYIIKREYCNNASENEDDFFHDLFVIAGSEDGKRLTSYYIGGYSECFAEEMYLLCGNN